MKDVKRFQTKNINRVCINLEPTHYFYLRELSKKNYNGNISLAVLYLVSKYLKYLYKINKTIVKKTFTITYQPKSKLYKKYWIPIQPSIWGQFNSLRFYLGFSMSFILRILIDWEMQSENAIINPLPIPKPNLTTKELRTISNTSIKSYAQKVTIVHRMRLVYMDFLAFY